MKQPLTHSLALGAQVVEKSQTFPRIRIGMILVRSLWLKCFWFKPDWKLFSFSGLIFICISKLLEAVFLTFFFCSTLLRCDLLAKKVPGRAPYSQHIIFRKWTYLNRSKTEHLKSFRPKTANKPINKLDRRRIWQKSVGSKSVQGEDRKERVANRELCRWQRSLRSSQPGRACSEEPVGEES